ncbi:MAG TPA: nucleoside hydrolase [Thermoanaerobaculia bacterium]|nr:nucleoside hydrolase [Thermoanaerobaculia bacterium]
MFFIDADNAFGSPKGAVDDAYAIAAMIRGGAEIAAISAVGGNTSEPLAHENNRNLARLLGWHGPVLRAAESRAMLRTFPGRILALGPLTNVAVATAASEVMIIGSMLKTRGRWPGFWPHEFNLTQDKEATHKVFASSLPLTFFPLDVVRMLSIRRHQLEAIEGTLGEELRRGSARWFRHRLLKKGTLLFPMSDLIAALYALDPDGLTMEDTTARMRANTLMEFGKGTRRVRVCTKLDAEKLWARFVTLVSVSSR